MDMKLNKEYRLINLEIAYNAIVEAIRIEKLGDIETSNWQQNRAIELLRDNL